MHNARADKRQTVHTGNGYDMPNFQMPNLGGNPDVHAGERTFDAGAGGRRLRKCRTFARGR